MTDWTAESLPPELVAILDERAGKTHSPNGAVRSCLAEILNAYDAMRAGPGLAWARQQVEQVATQYEAAAADEPDPAARDQLACAAAVSPARRP